MRVIKPQTLSLLTRPFEFRKQFWLGVAVIACVPLGATTSLLPDIALWPMLAEELPPDQALDAVIPKVQPEFLAVAHAFAPGGTAVPSLRVGIQLGPAIKTLHVFGDRLIRGSRITDPVPFTTMPIDWAHTYGGPGFADNPLGKGMVAVATRGGPAYPAPNVFDPALGSAGVRIPAGFGPLDQMWPSRARLAGTYDDAWLKQDFPGFARNMDWRFNNMAPPDQWLAHRLEGDETYACENLHPDQPLQQGRLPGMAPRLFLVRKGRDDSFEEVGLTLTTVWFFPHRSRLVLVHHGRARVLEEDAADIERAVIGCDRQGALRPAEAFHAVMAKRLDRKDGPLHTLRDADLVPAEWLQPDPATSQPIMESEKARVRRARMRKRAEAEREAVRARLVTQGLDPDKYGPPPLPPEKPLPTLEELPEVIAAARAEADAQRQKAEALLLQQEAEQAPVLAEAGVSAEAMRQQRAAKPKGPPVFSAAGMRAEFTAKANMMRNLGITLVDVEAQLADPEVARQWQETEAQVRRAYRLTAHHQAPADMLPDARSDEIRRLVSGDTAAARALYDLHGANLSNLNLAGINLSGVCLDGADLTGTSLAGAKLVNAVLAHARMAGCVLDDADLTGANLGNAMLAGASLKRAVLLDAVLAGTDLTDASLIGANLESVYLSETLLSGADLRGVRAPHMVAMKLSLQGLHAPRIVLDQAKFIECDLANADFSGGSLVKTVFLECQMARIRFAGARLPNAVFVQNCVVDDANFQGADLSDANLRETQLRRADFSGAVLRKIDLSAADLTGANLQLVAAGGARMIAAILQNATLRGGNFMQADLARADLRGADLTGISIYEANLARAQVDRDTKATDMQTIRTRYLPRYQPQEPIA